MVLQDVQFSFQKVNQNDIEIVTDRLHQKSNCGKDGLSTKLLRQLKTPLFEPLETIINQTLETGIFPDTLKIAKVIPLFKKENKMLFINYRPISILSAISKVFERIIYNQLHTFFQNHKLFYKSQ